MNKIQIIGFIILLISMILHFLININGFWIGASIGIGAGLLMVGQLKKA